MFLLWSPIPHLVYLRAGTAICQSLYIPKHQAEQAHWNTFVPLLRHLYWYLCLVYSFSSTVLFLADFLNTVYLLYKNNLETSLPLCTMKWFKYHWNYIFFKIYNSTLKPPILLLWGSLWHLYFSLIMNLFKFSVFTGVNSSNFYFPRQPSPSVSQIYCIYLSISAFNDSFNLFLLYLCWFPHYYC